MRVEVRLVRPDEPVRLYVERRLFSCVGHLERTLAGVTVCVSSLPGGGHRCRMLSRPLPWANVVVEEEGSDVYAAIDRAAERLARTIEAVARPPMGIVESRDPVTLPATQRPPVAAPRATQPAFSEST